MADPAAASGTSNARGRVRDSALDGLRGFATLWVFLYHYGGGLHSRAPLLRAIGYLTQAGWIGVEIFFALSGFLITASLLRVLGRPHGLRNYLARRALRILPLYYAALAAACAAGLVAGLRAAQWLPVLPYVFLLQDLPSLTPLALGFASPLPLHHLWSLAVEAQFYALWPLVVLPFAQERRLSGLVVAATLLFVVLSLARVVLFLPSPFLALSMPVWAGFLPVRAGSLVLGGALACLRHIDPRRHVRSATAALAGSMVAFLAVGAWCGGLLLERPAQMTISLAAIEIGSAALLLLTLEPTWLRRIASPEPLQWLGRISYGFYVFHLLLEPLFDTLALRLTHATAGNLFQLMRLLVAFPITLATAGLSYRFFELPILRTKRFYPMPPPLSGAPSNN